MSTIKKSTVTTLCMIMVGLFLAVGCKKDPVVSGGGTGGGEEPDYPIEIPFEEYSLNGIPCCIASDSTVIIINSDEEMKNFVNYPNIHYSEIDFSEYTLLAFNVKDCNIHSWVKKILVQQLSNDEYLLSIDVIQSDTLVAIPLYVAILVSKISEDVRIELNVIIVEN